MKVLYVASEALPFMASGGLGDVARIVNSPRIMPVDFNNDNSCEKQERICFNGKECGYEA